jgi:predicted CopG family antitoxin
MRAKSERLAAPQVFADNYHASAHNERSGQESHSNGGAMRNITVTIPDDVYRRARIWAAERDTSVSAVVKYLLETMPGIKRSNLAFPARNSNRVNTLAPSTTPPAQ